MWHFIVSTFWGIIGFFAFVIFAIILLIAEIFEWAINLVRKFSSDFLINQTNSDLSLWILVALFVIAFLLILFGEIRSNKKTQILPIITPKKAQSKKDYVSVIDQTVSQSKESSQANNFRERDITVKPILIDDFNAKNPFVMIEIPLDLREAFIEECGWYEKKLGQFPSQKEQANILQSLLK